MIQLFSSIFFSMAAIGALMLTTSMLRSEWGRIGVILAGTELTHARRMAAPPVRVSVRAWPGPERRRVQPLRAAA